MKDSCRRPFSLILLVSMTIWTTAAVVITDMSQEPEATISRGAHVTPVPDILLYTEMENLLFTIPDVPDPPSTTTAACPLEDAEACALFNGMQKGVSDISDLLAVVNRVLTTKGLTAVDPNSVQIPKSWVKILKDVNVNSNGPSPELITAAGDDWVTDTEARLTLRKLLVSGAAEISDRQRRWIGRVMKTGMAVAAHATDGDVFGLFKKLFVGDKSILSYITQNKVLSRKEYQYFADLPKLVSQLQVQTKTLFLDVLNSTEAVKKVANLLQEQVAAHTDKLATIEDAFVMEQSTLSDLLRSLYTTIVYNVHFAAYDECRSSKIPVAFVPPELLRTRLLEVEKNLPGHLRFVIPVEEFQRYYQLPVSQCVYDSSGGLIRISVPLVEKSSNLQLFEFKPLHFGHEGTTCAIQTVSSFIIKDLKNNRIFTVTEIDEELCSPRTTGLCKVPLGTADDSNSFCVSVLLSGEPAHVIKETCQLKCFPDNQPSISQITDDIFVGVHLPATGVRMECPDEVIELNTPVPHGSVRFQTACGCKIFFGSKMMGKSTTKFCSSSQRAKIDVLLPIQMTTFDDLLPFSDDGWDNTVFSHTGEILNKNFDSLGQTTADDVTEVPFRISTIVWNSLQSALMLYLYLRIKALAGLILTLGSDLPLVRAGSTHTCELPTEMYLLLWSILVLGICSLVPPILCKIYNVCKNLYLEHVNMVAVRYAFRDGDDA